MFQREKPIRGAMVSFTLPGTNTLLSHDPLTLHWLESNLSPSSPPPFPLPNPTQCNVWLPFLIWGPGLSPYSLWYSTQAPSGQFQPLRLTACYTMVRPHCCWQQKTDPQVSSSLTTQLGFSAELDCRCIPQSHFAFWKHVSQHSRTYKAVCLKCRDYIHEISTLLVMEIDKKAILSDSIYILLHWEEQLSLCSTTQ